MYDMYAYRMIPLSHTHQQKHTCTTAVEHTCRVTSLSSMTVSFVKKSAPMVALYCVEKRLLTYWFMSDVFPTLLSHITYVQQDSKQYRGSSSSRTAGQQQSASSWVTAVEMLYVCKQTPRRKRRRQRWRETNKTERRGYYTAVVKGFSAGGGGPAGRMFWLLDLCTDKEPDERKYVCCSHTAYCTAPSTLGHGKKLF